jgi:hypothetical protein
MVGFAGSAGLCQLTIYASAGGTTVPAPGSYEYAVGTNLTVTATPNSGNSLAYWVLNDQTCMQNPLLFTVDRNTTLQAVFVAGGLSGWTKTFGGGGTDQANAISQTSDGGYAVAGWTDSFGAGGRDFYLVETDANGNWNWSARYGGPGDDEAFAIVQTADEGFAIAGRTGSGIAGSYDAWLVKTDGQGNMQWSQAYGGSGNDCVYSILATATGYVLGGYTTSAGSIDFWLFSVNSTGGLEWSRTYGDPGWSAAYSMIQTSDGGYALAGYTNSSVSGFWLVKTDSLGDEEWNATYAGGIDGGCSVMQTNDGGYAIAGTTVQGVGASEFYLVKAAGDSAFQWSQTYDGPGYAHAYSLTQSPDGYLLAGSVYSFTGDFEKVFAVKTDVSGNELLNRTFGYPGYCAAYSMASKGNDEYVMAGTASWPERGTQGFDVLVMDVVVSTQYSLTIINGPGGHTSPEAGTYVYGYMENVTVTAVADDGYMLNQWLLDGNGWGGWGQTTVTMDGNHVLEPLFVLAPTSLILTINATAGGTTNPPPGNYTYGYMANVTVTAIPDPGYIFDYWMTSFGMMGSQNPNTIMMVQNVSLEAVFENAASAQRTLTITAAAAGTTDPPPGNYTYGYMANVTVTAIPDSGYVFDHWTSVYGDNFGSQNPWKLMMSWNFTIQPLFENATSGSRTLTIWGVSNGTTDPTPGTYTYNYGENATVTATPNSGGSFKYWVVDGQNVNENPITVQMTQDHTLQPVFTSNQGNPGQGGQSGQGGVNLSLNIPPSFILVGAVAIIACCSVGYLVPLALAMRKGQVPQSVRKPRLILALVSILIIVGPLGATLLAYSGNLNRVFTPSNVDKLSNLLSSPGEMMNFNVTSSWCNLTSRTFGMLFNFTNPTATDLTVIVFSANLADHSDGYPLGQISLASPVTAGANETVMFQVTNGLSEEAAGHVATAHAGAQSFAVDLSSENINFAGILLQMNGTSTVNNVLIVR